MISPAAFRDALATLLQVMWEEPQPEVWIFGHHHESRDFTLGATRFCCLDVREALTLTFHGDGSIEWPD